MAKLLKQMLAGQLQKELGATNGCLVLDPGPMSVEGASALRKELREKAGGARLRVIHNRTARVAIEAAWLAGQSAPLRTMLRGSTALAFGGGGPVPIAKVLVEYRKKVKAIQVKGAVADGEVLGPKDAEHLATLPGLPELRGQMASLLAGGARGLVGTLHGVVAGLVRVLKAHADKLGEAAPASPAADAPAGGAP